LASFAHSLV
ncbi:RVT_2 domain-containing protein, partial [Cephalotus follicularis]